MYEPNFKDEYKPKSKSKDNFNVFYKANYKYKGRQEKKTNRTTNTNDKDKDKGNPNSNSNITINIHIIVISLILINKNDLRIFVLGLSVGTAQVNGKATFITSTFCYIEILRESTAVCVKSLNIYFSTAYFNWVPNCHRLKYVRESEIQLSNSIVNRTILRVSWARVINELV
ncbi:hypothetical protein PHYBLDRAFT_164079 [Phycomyces blakesleeanus NRRL 1555(-)]|uniref:Uncharacterized protein n=1 Tax=Phycomyces blakesleeanus (strain ATCC 8743b / DSM 1359 / FGSC 10004 / NBRC 33097 / NRRL 1555) TaxID=763407 RepID=A0A167Q359_PHYB8|nr:hypothetical protein PHYBLDRAFT_164079 [Phycomyces blakesleeanus NRRL 1555(-)]OAD78987.1 hypothetical protein PHYBLDRAFT_164079 [Phycomyces blakesleeanus NRRL 1555(-)]|eukprot:XP_018297027.1 hypothetical protein PHYBLDRAFT_164079 [Phycomyces blakesleeanus NRRL 1555(-)]